MEQDRQYYHYQENIGRADLPVRDLIEEILAIALEKHSIEILVEFDHAFAEQNGHAGREPLQVLINHEDIVEGEGGRKITISGVFSPSPIQQETFTLCLSLGMDEAGDAFLARGYGRAMGSNVLHLYFDHREEHFYDSLFNVQIYHEEVSGQQYDLGQGSGFLVFGCESSATVN
ncbi:MAG: hypothetical protein ABFR63_11560 [Thermodesulfobacteriota bacterium]